jgi:hypothetical protein
MVARLVGSTGSSAHYKDSTTTFTLETTREIGRERTVGEREANEPSPRSLDIQKKVPSWISAPNTHVLRASVLSNRERGRERQRGRETARENLAMTPTFVDVTNSRTTSLLHDYITL